MSHTVKRQGEIKSFQFLLEGSCADFVTDEPQNSVQPPRPLEVVPQRGKIFDRKIRQDHHDRNDTAADLQIYQL